jgi:hypothetical protein
MFLWKSDGFIASSESPKPRVLSEPGASSAAAELFPELKSLVIGVGRVCSLCFIDFLVQNSYEPRDALSYVEFVHAFVSTEAGHWRRTTWDQIAAGE